MSFNISFRKEKNSRSPLLSKKKKKKFKDFIRFSILYNELAVLLSIELRNLLLSMSQFTISKVEYKIG